MKKTLLIALILTLTMGTAIAKQRPGGFEPPARGGGDPVERLTEKLGLDADQVADVTAIFEATQALHDEEREAFQAIICEIRADSHTQIIAVLTPEQQVLFEDLQQRREELKRAMEEARSEHGFGGGHRMMNCDG